MKDMTCPFWEEKITNCIVKAMELHTKKMYECVPKNKFNIIPSSNKDALSVECFMVTIVRGSINFRGSIEPSFRDFKKDEAFVAQVLENVVKEIDKVLSRYAGAVALRICVNDFFNGSEHKYQVPGFKLEVLCLEK